MDRCTRADRRCSWTACGALHFVNRHSHIPNILMDRSRFRKYECRVDIFHRLLEQSTSHSDPEDDHLRGECLMGEKGEILFSQWSSPYNALFTKVRTWDSTYTEHVPNIFKHKQERSILGQGDKKTDAEDGKGRGGLDEHRSKISVYPARRLRTVHLPHECSHS
jgi:hypothetical protein